MVNLTNVSYCEGTSRKGEIHFQGKDDTVPVSRNFARNIIDSLASVEGNAFDS